MARALVGSGSMMTRGTPSLEKLFDELAQDRRAVADADQLGLADRQVDAERAKRLVLIRMVVLQMRIVSLEVADRPARPAR